MSLGFGGLTGTDAPAGTGPLTFGAGGTAVTSIRFGTTSALTSGTITVTDTAATANSKYFFTTHTPGTITVAQSYRASTITPGTSFVITSDNATDTSTVDWIGFN